MPRVKTMKFVIDGNEYESHINFSAKTGLFSISLNWQVRGLLGLDGQLTAKTIDEIQDPINEAYRKYLDSHKKHELYISIQYKCSGAFARNSEGGPLFDLNGSSFRYSAGFDRDVSTLQFGFEIYCKQTDSSGVESWYNVSLNREGQRILPWTVFVGDHNEFRLNGLAYGVEGTLIPYTEKAYQTLKSAEEGIRRVSETLVNFLSQDAGDISALLNSGSLLKLNEQN